MYPVYDDYSSRLDEYDEGWYDGFYGYAARAGYRSYQDGYFDGVFDRMEEDDRLSYAYNY